MIIDDPELCLIVTGLVGATLLVVILGLGRGYCHMAPRVLPRLKPRAQPLTGFYRDLYKHLIESVETEWQERHP